MTVTTGQFAFQYQDITRFTVLIKSYLTICMLELPVLRSSSTKIHDELDIVAVQRIYEQAGLQKELEGQIISSPYDLYAVETLRDRHRLRTPAGIATDAFVFAEGESPKRHVTKVGGLPYWPADQLWPTTSDGSAMRFMAQFNFADSFDLLPQLPGDILLILTEDEDSWCDGDLSTMHFMWQTLKDQDLISLQEFPSFDHEYQHFDCYGVIHRTADYPESAETAERLEVRKNYNLAVLACTKIGGVPDQLRSNQKSPGIFLAQLGSIQPAPFVPYPWVNREAPYDLRSKENGIYAHQQTIGDMGSLYLFMNDDGSVKCMTECY
ncbi:MAG: DUF1963 domain-containing protein [Planctomycetaceae bacterium]